MSGECPGSKGNAGPITEGGDRGDHWSAMGWIHVPFNSPRLESSPQVRALGGGAFGT
jgi:hypothetical protein